MLSHDLISAEFDQCIKCGLCMAACPVCKELLLEKYTPRGKIQLARHHHRGKLELSEQTREIFAKCLLCGACSVTCPSGVDLRKVFLSMRQEIAFQQGVHPMMEQAVRSLSENKNISSEDNRERGEWCDDLTDVPAHLLEKDNAQVAYFVGCVASFFPMVQRIPRNVIQILVSSDVDVAVLSGEEWCCGYPLLGAGSPERMNELREHNLKRMHRLGVKQVVFSCPSCLKTWEEHYDTDLELFHSSQFIEQLMRQGALKLKKLDRTVTYHDPCDLGRGMGVFETPREILRAIPGLSLVELEKNRSQSVCCGGGGNLEMADPKLSGTVARRKLEQIQGTGARTVVTSCQQCVRTIQGRARRERLDLEVMDITDIVRLAMDPHG
jgi:heterodisulfide reductase subunit D